MDLYAINPFIRFASRMRFEMHYNQKPVLVTDCRIFYVIDGTLTIYSSDQTYTLVSGDLFYFNAGSQYTIVTQEGFSLFCLNFDLSHNHQEHTFPIAPTWQASQWETAPVYSDNVQNSSFLGSHLFIKNAAHLYDQIEKIINDFSSSNLYRYELSSARLKLLLVELHSIESQDVPKSILRVKQYIHQNYSQNITNQTLAELVGYHENYLNRLFVKHVGMSLHNYLVNFRLTQANYLILNTELSLQDIAAQTGFNSYPNFYIYYKKHYGYAPFEYRKFLKRNV